MIRQKSFEKEGAALYVVATPIGNLSEMTPRAIEVLKSVDVIAAEDTRNTMRLCAHFGIHTRLIAHHKYNEETSADGLLDLLDKGHSVALVSDAGYPLVSDPGYVAVQKIIEKGYPVIPISGSNAMLAALVASGLDTQHFLFYGFLKAQEKERVKELQALADYPFTMVFYEAPHRIEKMLKSMLTVFEDRNICLARELTKKHEELIRGTISEILEIVGECKGEMVVVVEGAKEKEAIVDATSPLVYEEIHRYIQEGLTTNAAIKRVAKKMGLSKNEVYKEFHELS